MTARRVLISGASIAGPALAVWLHRYGIDTVIVERAPELRRGGQNVDVRGAGREVARRMDVEDAIRAAYCSSARQAEYDGDHMRELALFRIAGGRVVSAGTPLRLRTERGANGIELPAGEDRTAAAV